MDTALAFDDWVKTYGRDCPSRTVIDVLANKWALYVLGALRRFDRPLRFNELRRLLDGVTQKMLTQTLRQLERDGFVTRTVYPQVPPKVEYALTPLGAGFLTAARPLWTWMMGQTDAFADARRRYGAARN
jgi:DNA-binding HxlR family transcriptional regulator